MPILDAILAFAVTMFVVATIVTQILGVLQNVTKIRNAQFQKMISEFLSKELYPVIERKLDAYKKKGKQKSLEQLMKLARKADASHVFDENEVADIVKLSTDEFKEYIKRSDIGKKIQAGFSESYKEILDKLGERYESISKKYTESFRKHSRRWTTGVALVLALVVNIDSINILDSYIKNTTMRQDAIRQSETAISEYDDLMKTLENDASKTVFTKEELAQSIASGREKAQRYLAAGFPVGWSYFRHSYFQKDQHAGFDKRNNASGWIMWIIGIMVTAMLAGLGAPFWYDAVTGISRVVRSVGTIKKTEV